MSKIKIAIPKSGRLHNDTLKCFTEAGFEFKKDNTGFQLQCINEDFDLVLMREKDIPMLVDCKIVQNGICGENTLIESEQHKWQLSKLFLIYRFSFGFCRLSVIGKKYLELIDLKNLKIATSYNNFIKRCDFLQCEVIPLTGSVEHAIELGISDAIIDIVETGETLRKSRLVEGETLMHSQAILIGKSNSIIENIIFQIKATEEAKNKRYIALNCKEKDIAKICNILPSTKSPTILPLSTKGEFAIHSLCNEKDFFQILKNLKLLGAKDIIITKPEKII